MRQAGINYKSEQITWIPLILWYTTNNYEGAKVKRHKNKTPESGVIIGSVDTKAAKIKRTVVGLFRGPFGIKKISLIILSLMIVIVGIYWFVLKDSSSPNRKPVTIDTTKAISGQVNHLDEAGLNELANSSVDPKTETAKAHAKALALSQMGNDAGAQRQYQDIDKVGEATQDILRDYMLAAASNDDYATAVAVGQRLVANIQSDTSVPQEQKDFVIRRLNSQVDEFKALGGQQ